MFAAPVPPNPEPAIVVTLTFPGLPNDAKPTYSAMISDNHAQDEKNGNIDFLGKENGGVKLTFQIAENYKDRVEFVPAVQNENRTIFALISRDDLTGLLRKAPFGAAHASNQFECDAGSECDQNTDKWKIVAYYRNKFVDGPYTRYGFRYRTKDASQNWRDPVTVDPGIKNGGGVSFAELLTALGIFAVSIVGGVVLIRRFLKNRLAP